MMEMKKRYLGFSSPDVSQPNQVLPQKLGVKSFIGFFIFMGIVIIAAVISSEISLIRKKEEKENCRWSQSSKGTRYTIGHIFCHIHDYRPIAAIISSDISVSPRNSRTRNEEDEQLQINIPE